MAEEHKEEAYVKLLKSEVGFIDDVEGTNEPPCKECKFYEHMKCRLVAGLIEPEAHCELWVKGETKELIPATEEKEVMRLSENIEIDEEEYDTFSDYTPHSLLNPELTEEQFSLGLEEYYMEMLEDGKESVS